MKWYFGGVWALVLVLSAPSITHGSLSTLWISEEDQKSAKDFIKNHTPVHSQDETRWFEGRIIELDRKIDSRCTGFSRFSHLSYFPQSIFRNGIKLEEVWTQFLSQSKLEKNASLVDLKTACTEILRMGFSLNAAELWLDPQKEIHMANQIAQMIRGSALTDAMTTPKKAFKSYLKFVKQFENTIDRLLEKWSLFNGYRCRVLFLYSLKVPEPIPEKPVRFLKDLPKPKARL